MRRIQPLFVRINFPAEVFEDIRQQQHVRGHVKIVVVSQRLAPEHRSDILRVLVSFFHDSLAIRL